VTLVTAQSIYASIIRGFGQKAFVLFIVAKVLRLVVTFLRDFDDTGNGHYADKIDKLGLTDPHAVFQDSWLL
jgi:hypothetical protein